MARLRRESPRFRRVQVESVEYPTPRMARITFAGPALRGLVVAQPAASVRLLLPSPGDDGLTMPEWNGNEFLRPGGERPIIRTFTPLRVRPEGTQIDLEIVLHEGGAAAGWAEAAAPGDEAAISGPGRGYDVDEEAPAYLLAGDETAIPAIGQLLEYLPEWIAVQVLIEITHPNARLPLPDHPGATVQWLELPEDSPPGEALVAAVRWVELAPGTRVWAAGEAAAMYHIRKNVFEERGLARAAATVRGYWKQRE